MSSANLPAYAQIKPHGVAEGQLLGWSPVRQPRCSGATGAWPSQLELRSRRCCWCAYSASGRHLPTRSNAEFLFDNAREKSDGVAVFTKQARARDDTPSRPIARLQYRSVHYVFLHRTSWVQVHIQLMQTLQEPDASRASESVKVWKMGCHFRFRSGLPHSISSLLNTVVTNFCPLLFGTCQTQTRCSIYFGLIYSTRSQYHQAIPGSRSLANSNGLNTRAQVGT
jgi:hypothetical protein